MSLPEVQCFHICFAVRDVEASVEHFRNVLGAVDWHIGEARPNGTRPAYGRGAGQTWELFEAKGDGDTPFHQFLAKYGEGVQHIGFWTPDPRAAVEAALADGAKLVTASVDANGNSITQLLPRASVQEQQLASLGMATFVEGGFGNVRIEYIGPAGDDFLHSWLGEKYGDIVVPPPWVTGT